jgi:hypothetical protein
MSNPPVSTAVRLLAEKLRSNPDFMAFVLEQFCKQEAITFAELPAALEIMPEMVTRLALCRTPDPDAADFAKHVREIAYYTLGDEAVLANVIRRVNSIQSLTSAKEEAFLAAARDRDQEDPEPKDQSDEDQKDKK